MVSIARADESVGVEEQRILERYRRALHVESRAELDGAAAEELPFETLSGPGAPGSIDLSAIAIAERIHVLRMMLRVAYADGVCSEVELALLEKLSGAMGLTSIQFADVQDSIERLVRHRRRMRRAMAVAGGAALLAVAVLVAVMATRAPDRDGTTIAELRDLRKRLDDVSVRQAELDGERIRETTERLSRLERDLTERLQGLEQQGDQPAPQPPDLTLAEELASLKAELSKLQSRQSAFKRIEKRYRNSVLLILVRYDLVSGSKRSEGMGFGTGFFVTPAGLLATSKHVVQPWKFGADSVKLLAEGYRLEESSLRYVAWTSGANLLDESEESLESAYDSAFGTLSIAATAPDRFEERAEPLRDGTLYEGSFHAQNDADVALLRAEVTRPAMPLRLAIDLSGTEKLDPVMVLGFPSGPAILESGRAETSPSLGEVRKIEDTVYVTAPIVPGNSGGPVVDLDGRVIAIATRTAAGEATLGSCIQSRHILPLLPEAAELVRQAAAMLDQGLTERGRTLLELASAREPLPAERARIAELERRLHR